MTNNLANNTQNIMSFGVLIVELYCICGGFNISNLFGLM